MLHADYSDPDVVRVGDDFYLTSSSFGCAPGLPILHSRDLVNWRLIGHALPRSVPEATFRVPQHGKGCWAPAFRHHAGKFWIYYPDPDFGIYVITATDPAGPWSAPVLAKGGKGLIDPCPLWDDDGQVYLIHAWAKSRAGFNNVLTLSRLSPDGLRAVDEGRIVIDGNSFDGYTTLEGPKLYKRGGEYFVFAPAGGVEKGWQSVFRSKTIGGPYQARIVLRQGATDVNGPHQGAWVTTPGGEDWFLHFQDKGAYGRVVHLQPMRWREDGWPVMGADDDGDGTGEPVGRFRKPAVAPQPLSAPPDSDEFDSSRLGLQWQWQANPHPAWLSLGARTGSLRLFGQSPPSATNLWLAPNLLLQKWPAVEFSATTALRFDPKVAGDSAGLIVFGRDYAWLGLTRGTNGARIVLKISRDAIGGAPEAEAAGVDIPAGPIFARVEVLASARCRFSYSRDGVTYTAIGDEFAAKPGHWVGAKVGLFALRGGAGERRVHADFDWFRVVAR